MSKEESEIQQPKRGRPRSEAAKSAILKAAKEMLNERGPAQLTIEAVARTAGVGKPTIYRYWSNAQELAMSALMAHPETPKTPEQEVTLTDLVEEIVDRLNTKRGRQMALMLAGAEPDSELFKAFSNRVILEGRQRGLAIIEAAQASGRISKSSDPALCIDMVLGAVFLRLLLRHADLDKSIARKAVEIVQKDSK